MVGREASSTSSAGCRVSVHASSHNAQAHKCRQSHDPRNAGHCACGRKLERLERDPEWERDLLRHVATGLNADVGALILFARKRAEIGERNYGEAFPAPNRDLMLEAKEELGDGTNYIMWKLDRIRRGLDEAEEWRVPGLQIALRHVALAFEEIRSVQ